MKTSSSSALSQSLPGARQRVRLQLMHEEPPLPAARDSRRLLRDRDAGFMSWEESGLLGPSSMMVLFLKHVHLQKDGGAEGWS